MALNFIKAVSNVVSSVALKQQHVLKQSERTVVSGLTCKRRENNGVKLASANPVYFNQIRTQVKLVKLLKIKKLKEYEGRKESENDVISRFKRLGNGLWIHRQPRVFQKIWRHRKLGGQKQLDSIREHRIVGKKNSEMLDLMVGEKWKKHRWTVSDPYKGFDDDCFYYNNPAHTPGLDENREEDREKYDFYRKNKYFQKYKVPKITRIIYQRPAQQRKPQKARSELRKRGHYGGEAKAFSPDAKIF